MMTKNSTLIIGGVILLALSLVLDGAYISCITSIL